MKSQTSPEIFAASIDLDRNLARTRFFGRIAARDLEAAAKELEGLLPQLRAGFTVLADLSGLDAMDIDCAPHMARIMDLCRQHGVTRVVRVIPDPSKDIGLNILSIIHYRGKVQIITCDTLAEAERAVQ